MKNNKYKGFTLIELLAVIVILATVSTIAIPQINKAILNSNINAFKLDTKLILSQISNKLIDENIDIQSINENTIESVLEMDNINYEKVSVTKINGDPYVVIKGKNKWDGLIAYGRYANIKVENNSNYEKVLTQMGYNTEKQVNEPVLSKGMIPIKWDGTKWINTTEEDSNWYDYTSKQWANAKTQDGSMWVWIPRYVYKISSGWHSNTTGTIDVKFSIGTDDTINNTVTLDIDTTSNASNNKWTNHPGFKFGSTELTGIWVAKFKATASEGVANGYTSDWSCPITGDNVTTKTIKVLPNAVSWRCIIMSNIYTSVRNMEASRVYGWNTASTLNADGTYATDNNNVDTHLMKNVEWGAAAYLSKSSYGKNATEVWINNNQNYITGCAGNSVSESGYNGCQNTYESTNGVQASTTGNIYGIYDMSGNSWERISAYVDNANTNLSTYGASVVNANNKYKDIYDKNTTDSNANNYLLTIQKKGEAVYETSSNGIASALGWYTDYTNTPNTGSPWYIRGGYWSSGSNSGLFSFTYTSGTFDSHHGFRPVLLVASGL